MTNNTKSCSVCGETKSLDEFHTNRQLKCGKKAECKECIKERDRKYYQENREKRLEHDRKYRKEHKREIKERNKKYCNKHKEEKKERDAIYYETNREEILRKNKIRYEKRRKEAGKTSMYENKNCASYLGVVIAERLCRHLFKDVEVMPFGNTGFDIVCNKGRKIDVKSSTTRIRKNKSPSWAFDIRKNKVADYFICVAFDNVTNLEVLYMWMIPGKKVSKQKGLSISLSRIHKWNAWKRSIEEVQLCCNKMKIASIKRSEK